MITLVLVLFVLFVLDVIHGSEKYEMLVKGLYGGSVDAPEAATDGGA
jgi:hypothetical protein